MFYVSCILSDREYIIISDILFPKDGEVSEWSMVQHWKCCVEQSTEGSNPSFSVIFALY